MTLPRNVYHYWFGIRDTGTIKYDRRDCAIVSFYFI